MTAPDLTTTYLGLRLSNPFMAGASPLGDRIDTIRRLEDAGCAAVVLHSLFEEQISEAQTGRIHRMDPLDARFSGVLSYYPRPDQYSLQPAEYLEHIRKAKAAVKIPIIASLNGTSPEAWLSFATQMQQAGADAIELNMYAVVSDPDQTAEAIERSQRHLVQDLKHELTIPVTVKLSPYYTAFAHVARELDRAGADGLVLFNRFLQPDVDLDHLAIWPDLRLSTDVELPLRLQWLAILHGRLRCSLAASGGVQTPEDGIKAIVAGAHAVQLVSAPLRHGPSHFSVMRGELARWMAALDFARIDDIRGRVSLAHTEDPSGFERGEYIRTLSRWDAWLAYRGRARGNDNKPPS